jgi:hypothetical protein
MRTAILNQIAKTPGLTKTKLLALVPGKDARKIPAFDRLRADGVITDRPRKGVHLAAADNTLPL